MAIPIFRISLSNATVLSIAYLAVAMLIEASRRWFPFRWTDRASLTVDWIPARTLDWMGLYEPIRRAVVEDRLSTFAVRMIFGATSIASIFLVVYTFAQDAYVEAVETGPFSDMLTKQEMQLAMELSFWASVVILPLALIGILAGIGLLARQRIGRTATLWWAWTTAGLGIVLLPLGLLATAGAVAVIVLLRRDDARAWTASRRTGGTDSLTV